MLGLKDNFEDPGAVSGVPVRLLIELVTDVTCEAEPKSRLIREKTEELLNEWLWNIVDHLVFVEALILAWPLLIILNIAKVDQSAAKHGNVVGLDESTDICLSEQAPMKVMVDNQLVREVLTLNFFTKIVDVTKVSKVVVAPPRAQVVAWKRAPLVQLILDDAPVHIWVLVCSHSVVILVRVERIKKDYGLWWFDNQRNLGLLRCVELTWSLKAVQQNDVTLQRYKHALGLKFPTMTIGFLVVRVHRSVINIRLEET